MTYSDLLRAYTNRNTYAPPSTDGGEDFSYNPGVATDPMNGMLRRLVSPVPQSSRFASPTNSWWRSNVSGNGRLPYYKGPSDDGADEGEDVVPGPMGVWEEDTNRPYAQTGKFGMNLVGQTGYAAPGTATPYSKLPDPAVRLTELATGQKHGFWEGAMDSLGGMIAGEGGMAAGRGAGNVIDTIMEAVGNVAGVALSAATSANTRMLQDLALSQLSGEQLRKAVLDGKITADMVPRTMADKYLDRDLLSVYQQAERDNPVNGLLLWGDAAKAQFQRDTEAGRMSGLAADFGPSGISLSDQLASFLGAMGMGMRTIQRGRSSITQDDALDRVVSAVRRGDLSVIKNERWRAVAERAQRGDFGPLGSQEAREKMMDQMVIEGASLRDPNDPEQTEGIGPTPFTGQGLLDMADSILTDPATLLSFGIGGLAAKGRSMARVANAAFFDTVPDAMRPVVKDAIEDAGKRIGNYTDGEQVWTAIGREQTRFTTAGRRAKPTTFETDVLTEALNDPRLANADWLPAARQKIDYINQFRKWEPFYRPIVDMVNAVNDPLAPLGRRHGAIGRVMDHALSAWSTEGVARSYGGIQTFDDLQRTIAADLGPEARRAFDEGFGVYTANTVRNYLRRGLVREQLRKFTTTGGKGAIPLSVDPNDILTARMRGATGKGLAADVEYFNRNVRPYYFAAAGKTKQQVLEEARALTARRAQDMFGVTEEQATSLVAKLNADQVAAMEASFFGRTVDDFAKARSIAMARRLPKRSVDPEKLTLLGPRQMTEQVGQATLDALKAGDMAAVHDAIERYDLLYESIPEHLMKEGAEADLRRRVENLIADQIEQGALPRELTDLKNVPRELRQWAGKQEAAGGGYRMGFRPTMEDGDMWRVSVDPEGERLLGVNPWTEHVGQIADPVAYTRWQVHRDLLFHRIRTTRIMAEAKVRMVDNLTTKGLSQGQAKAMWSRFIAAANEAGVAPRGMSLDQIMRVVNSMRLGDDALLNEREAVEVVNQAFEGNWRTVGLTQKGTGYAKTAFGGRTNWLGNIAERFYPKLRYEYNPVFQIQELAEPFVLNMARGYKVGFKPSDLDRLSEQVVEHIFKDSRYLYDDQMERSGLFLLGAESAHNSFGPGTRIGKILAGIGVGPQVVTRRLTGGRVVAPAIRMPNVARVKKIAQMRAMREMLGDDFRQAVESNMPGLAPKLRLQYGTDDWGKIAVEWWGDKLALRTPAGALKPENLGKRDPVVLDDVVNMFGGDYADPDSLRVALRDGSLTYGDFKNALTLRGAHPQYIKRAWATAADAISADEWWDTTPAIFGGNKQAARAFRVMARNLAASFGMDEDEFIMRTFADVVHSGDSADLASASTEQRRAMRFMADALDMNSPRQGVNEAVNRFRRETRFDKQERFVLLDLDGNEIARGSGDLWTPITHAFKAGNRGTIRGQYSQHGMTLDAHIDASVLKPALDKVKGQPFVFVHSHPGRNPFSPNDILSAIQYDPAEMWVVGPTVTHILKPKAGQTWNNTLERIAGDVTERNWYSTANKAVNARYEVIYNDLVSKYKGTEFWAGQADDPNYVAAYDAEMQRLTLQRLSDEFGWDFSSASNYVIEGNEAERIAALQQFALNPPWQLADRAPYAYRSQPLEKVVDRVAPDERDWVVAYEWDSRWRDWAPDLTDDESTLVMRDVDELLRTRLPKDLGVLVSDAIYARGGWYDDGVGEFTDAVNASVLMHGPRDSVLAAAALYGKSLEQQAVAVSRRIPGDVANYADNQRWGLEWRADRVLTRQELIDLQRAVSEVAPDIGGWGSSPLPDGTGIRFVRGYVDDPTISVPHEQWQREVYPSADKVDAALSKRGLKYNVESAEGVYDFHYVENDWEVNKHGERYSEAIRSVHPDGGRLERRLARETKDRLADSIRRHAGDKFNSHLNGLAAAGKRTPAFGSPGEYRVRGLDSTAVYLPGGRERYIVPDPEELTVWEKAIIGSHQIDMAALYEQDPLVAWGLNRALTKGTFKELEGAPVESVYNAFLFGALTPEASLASTESLMAGMRAQAGGMQKMVDRAETVVEYLPDAQGTPDEWGFAYQVDYGMRVFGEDIDRLRGSYSDEERFEIRSWIEALDQTHANDPDGWAAKVPALQKQADDKWGKYTIFVHERGLRPGRDPDARTFATVNNPQVKFRGEAANRQMGRVMQWLNSGLFNSQHAPVNQFLRPQSWESMDDYVMRMSSVLPGIGPKTAILSGMSTGPRRMTRGAMDTHVVRRVLDVAERRGDLDNLYAQLTPGYAEHLRSQRAKTGRGYISPDAKRIELLPTAADKAMPWGPEKEARMRSRLHLIPDPQARALYDDSEVLRFVANNNGRVADLAGSNYEVIENYFSVIVRQDEMDRLIAAGQHEAAERIGQMSGGEWQWFMWDTIRADQGGFLDPHIGISRAANLEPPRNGLALGGAFDASIAPGMTDPEHSLRLMQRDGNIYGATVLMDDLRALLVATQHADARTGIHEFFHAVERWLDPSMKDTVLNEYRAATGSARTTWGREVSEWWADSAVTYFQQPGKFKGSRALRSSFETVRTTVDAVETSLTKQATERTLIKERGRAITRAEKAVERTRTPLGDLNRAAREAERAAQTAQTTLRRARGKRGIGVLEQNLALANEDLLLAEQEVKSAAAGVRIAKDELKQAQARAKQAAGTPSAGGLTAVIGRRQKAVELAEGLKAEADMAHDAARAKRTKASRALTGAKRRVPLDTHIRNRDAARDAATKARGKAKQAADAHQQAKDSLADARALPTKAAPQPKQAPPLSPAMHDLFDDILRPPEKPDTKWGPGSPIDAGAHNFNIEEEALYQAAYEALARAEDASHTLQYYQRGRSFVERSANHVYFGLYPASYMWGKVLPEVLRFMLKKPFGLDAPLGGLLLTNQIYRQVLMQQQFDEDFRKRMAEDSDFFHFMSMLTPATPWEIPVNAPLWLRRLSENGLERIDKMEELTAKYGSAENIPEDKMPKGMDWDDFNRTLKDMLTYAIGPLYGIDVATTVVSQTKSFGDAVDAVDTVLRGGEPEEVEETEEEPAAALPSRSAEMPALPGARLPPGATFTPTVPGG